VRNGEIAEAFEELASLYELDGAVVYRVGAYRNAAKAIREAGVSVEEMARQGRVEELSGVGKTIAEKIDALLENGSIPAADKLKARIPSGLVEVTRIPGLGPKRARLLYESLDVESIDDLREATEQGRLKDVPGFGEKAEENVKAALAAGADGSPKVRMLLSKALAVGEELVAALREHPSVLDVELAGSARRWADDVKDLDIVAASSDPGALVEAFCASEAIDVVHSSGPAGARVLTHSGLPVDLRIVPAEAFGNLLQHFTGSGRHNEALRTTAVKQGLHVSEYGIADDETGDSIAYRTEEEVYERLGLQWIAPELREDRGELAAARKGELPRLIELEDIRGDLHMHTSYSDGRDPLRHMVLAARALGYEYIAITDHSWGAGASRTLAIDEIPKQRDDIAALRSRFPALAILHGVEVDIRASGHLDLPDEILAGFDIVLASLHDSAGHDAARLTERTIGALRHPLVNVLCHPANRLVGRFEGYTLDFDAVFATAVETGTALEVDGAPSHIDLDGDRARDAIAAGVTLTVDSDCHRAAALASQMRFGVGTARRGWVEARHVLNTRALGEVQAFIAAKRAGRRA
jgi:DNA polymerase (family 10)